MALTAARASCLHWFLLPPSPKTVIAVEPPGGFCAWTRYVTQPRNVELVKSTSFKTSLLCPGERVPHPSRFLSANTTWEMAPVNSFQSFLSFACLVRTCRDIQGPGLLLLPIIAFAYFSMFLLLIIFSLIYKSSLLSQQLFLYLSLTYLSYSSSFFKIGFISCSVVYFYIHEFHEFHVIHGKKGCQKNQLIFFSFTFDC